MWILLSTRLRTWLLVAIAVPVTRHGIRYAASFAERKNPDRRVAKSLRSADSVLARFDRRARRKARKAARTESSSSN